MAEPLPEVWLRGPLTNIPPLLQPAAHALLQAAEELVALTQDFPDHLLWERPFSLASVGFHLLHIAGVLDRMGTYAVGGVLREEQFAYLKKETLQQGEGTQALVTAAEKQIQKMITQLSITDEATLTEERSVGRKKLPSTVQGLLFHAAEHTMRHLGQLLVTVKILKG